MFNLAPKRQDHIGVISADGPQNLFQWHLKTWDRFISDKIMLAGLALAIANWMKGFFGVKYSNAW